ncbi:hypothetical protein Hanom_Chr03g00194891 [Helianthus anomalus]
MGRSGFRSLRFQPNWVRVKWNVSESGRLLGLRMGSRPLGCSEFKSEHALIKLDTVVVAAVSLLGTLPALASFSESTTTTNKWVTRALALPTAGTASKKEIRSKQNLR